MVPIRENATERNLCFCTHDCNIDNETCYKEADAACYRTVLLVYNNVTKQIEKANYFGCFKSEKPVGGSLLACNAYRSPSGVPKATACCNEGKYCNSKLLIDDFLHFEEDNAHYTDLIQSGKMIRLTGFMGLASLIGFLVMIFLYGYFNKKRREEAFKKKLADSRLKKSSSTCTISSGMSNNTPAPFQRRTVAQDVTYIEEVAKGRYGCVHKAIYRKRIVAVKAFYTSEEDSWRNEKEVYETKMLNHENILQFIAADISCVDSITKMLLITDYHDLGSLFDYLKRQGTVSLCEALELALTTVNGLEHMHTKVRGTGDGIKPEIAHRDIKSKNIIVKRKNVCCLADFGLAVRLENGDLKPKNMRLQSGTRRYMSPEALANAINVRNFIEFKSSDLYSLSLVFWELFNMIDAEEQFNLAENSTDSGLAEDSNTPLLTEKPTIEGYPIVFSDIISRDPLLEEMKVLVYDKQVRPPIPPAWNKDTKGPLYEIATLVQEMWSPNPASRHTALKVKMCLQDIIKNHMPVNGNPTHTTATEHTNSSSGYGTAGSKQSAHAGTTTQMCAK